VRKLRYEEVIRCPCQRSPLRHRYLACHRRHPRSRKKTAVARFLIGSPSEFEPESEDPVESLDVPKKHAV